MIKLPQQNIWQQLNLGDRFGDIWSSLNLDLTKKLGTLLVSGRLLLNISTTDDDQLSAPPCAFKAFITIIPGIWAIAGSFVWHTTNSGSNGGPNDTFIPDATSGTPTDLNSNTSDMVEFNLALYVSGGSTNVYKLASDGTWSTLSNVLVDGSALKAMTYFRAQNRLYVVDDNAAGITSINTSDTVVKSTSGAQYSLDNLVDGAGMNVGSNISCITSNSSRIWIGTINQGGSFCRVYAWDGSQASGPNESYIVHAKGILSIVIKDDVPVLIDTNGRLLQLNGGTFSEIDRLPFENEPTKLPVSTSANRMVHHNGMTLINGRINFLANTQLYDTNSTNKENIPSGVWEYTKETGLYHKASVGLTKSGGTITDYGQQKLSLVGAIAEIEVSSTDITQGSVNGRYMVGCDYYTDATTALSGIFYDDSADTLQKYGYFVTSKIFSPNIQDTWQKVYARIKKLLASTDSVTVKYRVSDLAPLEGTITWINTNSFSTSVDLSGFSVGDEVEILQGTGGGKCAHVTALQTGDSSSYIVTLDDNFTGVTTGTAIARFQKWTKIASQTSQASEVFEFPVGANSSWVQFKVCMQFTGKDELNDFIIANKVHRRAE